jgi:hypothetical protein
MAQAVGTTEIAVVLLGFSGIVTLEADMCGTSAAGLVNLVLRDIVAGVLGGRPSLGAAAPVRRSIRRP